jgi:hypothetical protein
MHKINCVLVIKNKEKEEVKIELSSNFVGIELFNLLKKGYRIEYIHLYPITHVHNPKYALASYTKE